VGTIVRTTKGELEGTVEGKLLVFRGIPFAKAPVGDLRFRPPRPMEPWQGVRDASRFGCRAVQIPNEALEAILGRPESLPPISEDCLNLNVWTPALDEKRRPVMVWIHGGGFTTGAGSEPICDGQALVSRDVVLVTINYRLGPLGFLCAPGFAEGDEPYTNFGILDQIAALEWVKAEIASFGGDPGNVTIFGESAGAMSVGTLLGAPAAKGLFQKAILQSGAAHQVLSEEVAAKNIVALAEAMGMKEPDVAGLRARPLDDIVEAQKTLDVEDARAQRRGAGFGLRYQPVLDGNLLPKPPIEQVRDGFAKDVPLLIGTTAEEYKVFGAMMPFLRDMSPDDAASRLSTLLPGRDVAKARSILKTYEKARKASDESTEPFELFCAAVTDWLFRVPADRLAEAQAKRQKVFSYRLDWRSPYGEGLLGACHAIDLPFVFGTHKLARRWVGRGEDVDALAAKIEDAWVAFARTGDPTTDALAWPEFDAARRKTMVLDRECRVVDEPREEERRCWDGVIA
jgi:para-nitrobenzyl esterase